MTSPRIKYILLPLMSAALQNEKYWAKNYDPKEGTKIEPKEDIKPIFIFF